jgi:hypothetical protein
VCCTAGMTLRPIPPIQTNRTVRIVELLTSDGADIVTMPIANDHTITHYQARALQLQLPTQIDVFAEGVLVETHPRSPQKITPQPEVGPRSPRQEEPITIRRWIEMANDAPIVERLLIEESSHDIGVPKREKHLLDPILFNNVVRVTEENELTSCYIQTFIACVTR